MKNRWLIGVSSFATLVASHVGAAPAPADSAISNKQQILYWLEKRGEIASDATESEKQLALKNYMTKGTTKEMLSKVNTERQLRSEALASRSAKSSSSKTLALASSTQVAEQDVTKTVKVLAVLVDFPDLPYDDNQLTSSDTDMYYSSYTTSHYDGLLFSDSGYTGPSGQTLQSAYQYYQSVSGGSFYFTGTVIGWVTASHDAAYYGANDADNDDNDIRATDLVAEAVTAAVSSMTSDELAEYDVEDPYDLDGDGNLEESDGILDHVMVFHSSIGEESGGGVLGEDAIWSHRYYVENDGTGYGQLISGTSMRVFGYTIQPIDAAVGVCVHEFGHDLGLPDEYDSANDNDGSPVGEWSLMANGSWTGSLAGAQPSGFSPYARSYLQEQYQGKWLNEQTLDYSDLTTTGTDYTIYQATDADEINQIAIDLPVENVAFNAPYEGDYQYYSGHGNEITNAMSFDVDLPSDDQLTLTMKAKWDIEDTYDYVQVMADGVAVVGNYTVASNSINNAANILTGSSSDLSAADSNGWVTLTYDLSAYAGMSKQISIVYTTDESVAGDGFEVDNISLNSSSTTVFEDDAEQDNSDVTLSGFSRIDDTRAGEEHRYLVQLRSFDDVDAGLSDSGYEAGVLVWYENHNVEDNEVNEHPGEDLIGVIDADQNLIGTQSTSVQMRDAAFSLYDQSSYWGDTSLLHTSLFDDRDDYSAPDKPAAGLVLPALGVIVEVVSQEQDNSMATVNIRLASDSDTTDTTDALAVSLSTSQTDASVTFSATVSGGTSPYTYLWSFGDGSSSTSASPTHSYDTAGSYTVTLTVTDSDSSSESASTSIEIASYLTVGFTETTSDLTVQFTNTTSSNIDGLSYSWDFGDGSSSSATSPMHTYSAAGTYTVTLTVNDGSSDSTYSASVTVSDSSSDSGSTDTGSTDTTGTTTTTTSSSSSGGGSVGLIMLSCLALVAWSRRKLRELSR